VKKNTRDLFPVVESCYTDSQDFTKCRTEEALDTRGAFKIGLGRGEYEVRSSDPNSFTVIGHSPTGNDFSIETDASTGESKRDCVEKGRGGCPVDGDWRGGLPIPGE
jgi:hypothetical protein